MRPVHQGRTPGDGSRAVWLRLLLDVEENTMMMAGSILIDKDAARPQCFHTKDSSFPDGWMGVTYDLNPHQIERELSVAGWTFFFMANVIRATVFGSNPAKMMDTALKRLIRSVRQQRCNCLEIDVVATHSFLGMPYVSVSAHPRHIQKGMVFSGQSY